MGGFALSVLGLVTVWWRSADEQLSSSLVAAAHSTLEARVGERVRIWVLAARPSCGISFHVVGGVFDTVFKEGEYLLRPDNETGGGAQASMDSRL